MPMTRRTSLGYAALNAFAASGDSHVVMVVTVSLSALTVRECPRNPGKSLRS